MPLPRFKPTKVKRRRSDEAARQWLEQRLYHVEGRWSEGGDLLNLTGWRTLTYKETEHDVVILAAPTTEPTQTCASCGAAPSKFQKWGMTALSYLHDLQVRNKRTRIYFQRQRYLCSGCGKTLLQPLAGVDERRMITTRLLDYIKQKSLSIFHTTAGLADEVGYSEQTIRNLATAHALKLENERVVETPKWLAIDEVHIENQARCVISDPANRRVIHMLLNNSQKELEIWLLQLPDRHRVEVVTIDMWAPYFGAIQLLLPEAEVVVDRYHVHNLLNMAIKDVLAVLRASMSYSEQRKFMRDPLILLTSQYHLEGRDARKEK
jgi:transposase